MKKLILAQIMGVVVVFFLCSSGFASDLEIDQAEQLIGTKQVDNIEQAIDILQGVLAAGPDGEALWLIAKAHLYLGDRSPSGAKLALYEQGKSYADQAVELLPDSPDAFFWQSVLLGRVGQTKGILNSLFMISPFMKGLERVLELDPDYADAYFALSQLYMEAPGFPLSVGNKNKALEAAEKAVELEPDNAEYSVQLARVFLAHRRSAEAVGLLSDALDSPEMEIDYLLKSEAEDLLASIKR